MKGRAKWTKIQIASKARYAKTRYRVLAWLAKQKNAITAFDLTEAMGWRNKYYAPRLLLSFYRQGLVTRELMIPVPGELRPRAKLPYLYRITKKGLGKAQYWGLT